jgi:hypothetical protein
VNVYFFYSCLRSDGEKSQKVFDMGVNTAIRNESDQVEAVAMRGLENFLKDRVTVESAILNGEIDTGEFLIDDATCAEIKMTYFGIPHLAFGQADLESARLESGLGINGVELIMHWGRGQKGGVSLEAGTLSTCWIDPPTVTNEK